MATTEAVIVPELLKYKTWNLKVSIHCEGCRRKVKKVLQSIEGVYTTNIDPKQHRVSVTGNVAVETLIKKLIKSGKQAQLWPEPPKKPNGASPDGSSSKKKKSKNKNKPNSDNLEKKQETEPPKEEEDGDEDEEDSPAMEEKNETPESNNKTPPKPETEMPSSAGKKKKKKKNTEGNSNGNPNPNSNGNSKPAGPEEMKKQAATELFSLRPPAMLAAAVPQYVVSYSNMMPPMKISADISQSHGRSRPLPGQDITTLRCNLTADSNVSEVVTPKYNMWPPPSCEEERNEACTPRRKLGSENWIQTGRHEPTTFTNMLSGFQITNDSHNFSSPLFDHNPSGNASSENHEEGELTLFPSHWSLMAASNPSSFNMEPNLTMPTQDVRYGGIGDYSSLQGLDIEQNYPNWFTYQPSKSHMENVSHPKAVRPQPPVSVAAIELAETPKGSSGTWKIFGFNLNSNPTTFEPHSNAGYELESCSQPAQAPGPSQPIEPSKSIKSVESASAGCEREKNFQHTTQGVKDIQSKPIVGLTRSCTKVHKQGIALGRSVDLTRFNCYDELTAELDRMFEFEGQLLSPNGSWMIVYTDGEGDMMLVGDDPWQEFCSMVRKIYIYTKEEVHKMNPGTTLSMRSKDASAVAYEESTEEEVKSPLPKPIANPEKS